MADAVGLWVIVYFCVTSVNTNIFISTCHCVWEDRHIWQTSARGEATYNNAFNYKYVLTNM